ncbi:MAG: hypothetical protein E7031_06315 [Akkermansiaceae bacterium]|nr:hypothetical protein [Akkermansiaceae bacterium]
MNRLKYLYWLTPLMVLLSCGRMLTDMLGTGWLLWLVIAPAILLTWGIVWVRLYNNGKPILRPEFAILSILPQSIYFLAKTAQTDILQHYAWQNIYVVCWVAFVAVVILSLKPKHTQDRNVPPTQDLIFCMMCILTVVYAFTTMGAYAAQICYS